MSSDSQAPVKQGFVRKYRRLFIGVVVLSAMMYALRNFSIPDCATIKSQMDQLGFWAPLSFFLIYILATVAFIPGTIVTLMAGLLFGPVWGTLIVAASATVGATVAFLAARYIARDAIEGILSKQSWFNRFRDSIEENGFNFVIFVRLVPIFPFNGLNYACGLVPLKLRDYFFGSLLGMIPGTFAYVYLGATGCQIIDSVIQGKASLGDLPPEVRNSLITAIVLLAALSFLPIVLKKIRKKKNSAPPGPPAIG